MLFTQGGLKAGDSRARAGRRRRRRHRADRAGPRRRPAGLGDQPRRGQAGPGARARRARGVREQRQAARQGRRGDGDRRPGHLVALDPVAASRRHHRDQRYDERAEARRRRADPDLLPPAAGHRLDDGHPRRAGRARADARRHRRPAADRPGAADGEGPRRASPRWPTATCSARSSSPADAVEPRSSLSRRRVVEPASQVASRSTGTSKSGWRSTNSCSRSASQATLTSSSPRRLRSSSMPRSVKYMARSRPASARTPAQQRLLLLDVPAVLTRPPGRSTPARETR